MTAYAGDAPATDAPAGAPPSPPTEAPQAAQGQSEAPRTEQPRPDRGSGERRGPRGPESKDTVFIGKKPLMAYVTSTLLQLAEVPSVTIKARGMSISRAVDVAQIISRKRDNAEYTIDSVTLGSESLESTDGKQRNVSTITIGVSRS